MSHCAWPDPNHAFHPGQLTAGICGEPRAWLAGLVLETRAWSRSEPPAKSTCRTKNNAGLRIAQP